MLAYIDGCMGMVCHVLILMGVWGGVSCCLYWVYGDGVIMLVYIDGCMGMV